MEIKESDDLMNSETAILVRRLRRGSSLYQSSPRNDSGVDHSNVYINQLKKEKNQWMDFQDKVVADAKKIEGPIKCDMNNLNTELKDYCNAAPDMIKFAADTKKFLAKLEFYNKMEKSHTETIKHIEDTLKEAVDKAVTKLYVDNVEEKIYF